MTLRREEVYQLTNGQYSENVFMKEVRSYQPNLDDPSIS
jgi:hypothetical protein